VDFLTLANNHMLDRWFNGVKNTVNWVRQYGFNYVGAYLSPQERATPVIYEVNGIKIGCVAYTHTTNTQEKVSDPEAVEYGVPYLYKADIEADIQRLRDAGEIEQHLLPVDTLFSREMACTASAQEEKRIRCGTEYRTSLPDGLYRVYGESGAFLMLGRAEDGAMKTIKNFFEV
jgi:hypothetical protein